jgi:hypothetical protein
VLRNVLVRALPAVLPALGLSACLSGFAVQDSEGLSRVDQLLNHVEHVQVEAVVTKERAHAALGSLQAVVAPGFQGDPVAAHLQLVQIIEQSLDQALAFRDSVEPLQEVGEDVFEQWTADLESFGNSAMRQRSQARLEETRSRYQDISAAAVSAQLNLDALNADLSDYALFLQHDFNAASVAMISGEVETLGERLRELDRRLDACAVACQAYVESSALRGQLQDEPEPEQAAPAARAGGAGSR